MMKIFRKIMNFLRGKKECDHSEHCPIYLSYLGEYGKNSKKVKYCKNKNNKYCTKYKLVDQNEWSKSSLEEKLKIIKEMNLVKFLNKD